MSWNIKTPGDYINGPLTVAGNTTITGDLTVDTSTLKVDSANNRVGILTASPRSGFALDVLGSAALGDSTTNGASRLTLDGSGTVGNVPIIRLRSAGVQKAFFGLSGGFIGDTSTDAFIGTDAAGAAIRFYTSDTGVEVARFNSTGNLAFANTKGIDFSAVTGGTGTATGNVLNDYEEGTFTAGITFGGGSTGITYSQRTFRYTKVGRVVYINGYLLLSNKGSSTGQAVITGLPFAIANSNSAFSAASLWSSAITPNSGGNVNQAYGVLNTTTMNISTLKTDGTYSNLYDSNFANNSELMMSFTYTV